MKLRTVSMENFRARDRLSLNLGRRLTVLLGENSSGKTTVLDAMSIGLGAILTHLPGLTGTTFRRSGDLRQHENMLAPYARIILETCQGLQWDRMQRRDRSRRTAEQTPKAIGLKALEAYLDATVIDLLNQQQSFELPFFVFYGVGRVLLDPPLSRKGFSDKPDRLQALDKVLLANSRFKTAFVWFYNKEIEELRLQKERRSFDVTLPALDVVRRAITSMFPDLGEPHIETNPLRFVVRKDSELLNIADLSDGYKTLFALVVDLASRMAIAHSHLTDPLAGEAIVMIDEVDLHLHPAWQQRVVGDLLRTFPNAQFVMTTHSPVVVEAINNYLKRYRVRALDMPDAEIESLYALDPSDVAAYLMTKEGAESLLVPRYGLLDDKLLAVFNEVNARYDRMRDMEWQAR